MPVFRIEKNNNFTIMSNYHLRDKNLSLKSKGLLSFMLSLPDDWDYSLRGLVYLNKESINVIRNVLKELQDYDYLVIEKKQDEKGRFEYNYIIYENPHIQKGDVDKPYIENDTQINTNILSINKKIDKYDKTKIAFFKL